MMAGFAKRIREERIGEGIFLNFYLCFFDLYACMFFLTCLLLLFLPVEFRFRFSVNRYGVRTFPFSKTKRDE